MQNWIIAFTIIRLREVLLFVVANVGHYQREFGLLPMEELLALSQGETLAEDQADWIADGLEHLAVTIATIKDNEKLPTMQ